MLFCLSLKANSFSIIVLSECWNLSTALSFVLKRWAIQSPSNEVIFIDNDGTLVSQSNDQSFISSNRLSKCFKYVCKFQAYVSILKQVEHFSHTSLHGYTHFISLRKTFDWKLKIPGFCLIHELNKQSTVQKSIALKL